MKDSAKLRTAAIIRNRTRRKGGIRAKAEAPPANPAARPTMSPSVIKWRTSWLLVNPLVNNSPISFRRKLKDDCETVRPTYQAIKNTGIETAVKVSLSEKMVEENACSWPRRLSFGENPYCNARFEIRASICWIVDMLLSIAKGLISRFRSRYTFTCAEML